MERICVVDFDEQAKRPYYQPLKELLEAEAVFTDAPTADTWEHIGGDGDGKKHSGAQARL